MTAKILAELEALPEGGSSRNFGGPFTSLEVERETSEEYRVYVNGFSDGPRTVGEAAEEIIEWIGD